MIGGAVHGTGGAALGHHNANTAHNDDVRAGESRGLMSYGIEEQIAELTILAGASGHKTPIRHAFASPSAGAEWGDAEWSAYWSLYEEATGLETCPFSEAIHAKPGDHDRPEHRHRVYLALTTRGTLVRSGNDYMKQEAVSRITEYDTGASFTKGKHNVRAERFARELGRDDVADAMIAAGLLDGTRAVAALTSKARAQQERTGIQKIDVSVAVAVAWAASDNQLAFAAALKDAGLTFARGDRKNIPMVIDASGSAHSLTDMLQMHARAEGHPSPKAASINARIDLGALPTVTEARAITKEAAEPQIPATANMDDKQPNPPMADPPKGGQPSHHDIIPSDCCNNVSPAASPSSSSAAEIGFHTDALEGPGEPPGPGASPDEIARYRLRLALY